MPEYLRDDQHYIDRYDLQTIEKCLGLYWRLRDVLEENRGSADFKDWTQEKFDAEGGKSASYVVNVLKAERYKHKAETIDKWKAQDKRSQEKYDAATPPRGIVCKKCSGPTEVILKNSLDIDADSSYMLFMFECVKCKARQGRYENGLEWHHKPSKCPECSAPLNEKSKSTKKLLTTLYSCPKCSYKKKDVYDFEKSKNEQEARTTKESQLFADYREQLCLDDVKGPELIRSYEALAQLTREWEEQKKKGSDPSYQKVQQLKRLTLAQLEKLLEAPLEAASYKDLRFGKPEMGKYVIVDFTVNDALDGRGEHDSQNSLKKFLKKALEDTTWRLMSEGIQYRLGILTGRLKAYEQEEELVELVKGNLDNL